MTVVKRLALTIIAAILLSGCDFIQNTIQYNDSTKEFVESLIAEDYDRCIAMMALDSTLDNKANRDTFKMSLVNFRQLIVDNWGKELEFSFAKSEKKISTNESESTPPNTTRVYVEFKNEKEFGVLEALFDDTSKKIINIKTLNVKAPVPNMTLFWLFGLIAICVPIFNIYVIIRLAKSKLSNKPLKYLAVFALNVPTISYAAINGLSFKLLGIQILLGVSFSQMGYLNSVWDVGIPLGGLYWLWKLTYPNDKAGESPANAEENVQADSKSDQSA